MKSSDFLSSISTSLFKSWNYSNLEYSTRFSLEEHQEAIRLLKLCNFCPSDYRMLDFYWNSKMEKDCISCWDWKKPNLIFVSEHFQFNWRNEGFKKLIGPISHELRHRKQYDKLGLLYFLLSVPVVRNITLEIDANSITMKVNKFFNIDEGEWL